MKLFNKQYTYFFTYVVTEDNQQVIKSVAHTIDFKIKNSYDIYKIEQEFITRFHSNKDLLIINYIRLKER